MEVESKKKRVVIAKLIWYLVARPGLHVNGLGICLGLGIELGGKGGIIPHKKYPST